MATRYAFVTLLTSDSYLPGALALVAALSDVHLTADPAIDYRTVCLVTPESVDVNTIKLLRRAFDEVVGVEILEGDTAANLRLLGREDLTAVLTKLHVFRLTQYDKLIFLDADVLPVRALSHLFLLPYEFSAVPDVGWPDIFNSGMFVFSPGEQKFTELMDLVKTKGTWDGGDQGLLNEWRGQNWNRLSFIYNTTPTAAYTYAPAYERFGSKISAIHFIGPNKPWSSIPYRAPGSQAVASHSPAQGTSAPSATPLPSYAYGALLDKWFDVYDRHYRQPATAPSSAPESNQDVQHYSAVWDQPAQPAEDTGNALGLEDLRRLAVQGVNYAPVTGSSIIATAGKGTYYSLPLEGRVDLMRPKREAPPPSTEEGEGYESGHATSSGAPNAGDPPRLGTLPTPGPNEQPPAPHPAPVSLPRPDQTTPTQTDHQHQHYRGDEGQPPGGGGDASHYSQHHPHQAQQAGDSHSRQAQYHPPQPDLGPSHHRHQPQGPHAHHDEPRRGEEDVPFNPPLLTWNAAVEPPPTAPPPPNVFPSDSYFPNVWDRPQRTQIPQPSQQQQQRYQNHQRHHTEPVRSTPQNDASPHVPASQSNDSYFFQPPPPTRIPQQLLREGHYVNVTGPQHVDDSSHRFVQPQPDRAKVTTVFPWEERRRPAPGRVFPQGESPPPVGRYIGIDEEEKEEEPQTQSAEAPVIQNQPTSPSAPVQSPPPPSHFDGGNFRNAWDAVPSIQRYAAQLARPSGKANTPQPWPMAPEEYYRQRRGRKDSYQNQTWEGRGEPARNSEGEDDGDDEDSEVEAAQRASKHNGKARSMTSGGDSSGGSGTHGKYVSECVQTIPPETRSFGVQVSLLPETAQGPDKELAKTSKWHGTAVVRAAAGQGQPTLPMATMQHLRLDEEQHAVESPNIGTAALPFPSRRTTDPIPYDPVESEYPPTTGVISPRMHETHAYNSPTIGTTSPTGTHSPPKLPSLSRAASSSNETASVSTPSTIAPDSPEQQPGSLEIFTSPLAGDPPAEPGRRKVGRVWDPARGVDVFKRSSEEVLARFLRMGS